MDTLMWKLVQRLRPQIGWPQFLLGLGAVLCTAFAASDSKLNLPSEYVFWAGVLGFVLGLRLARQPHSRPSPHAIVADRANAHPRSGDRDAAPSRHWIGRIARSALRAAVILLLVVALGTLLIIAAAQTLPPFGLVSQDVVALLAWLGAALRRAAGWADLPEVRAWPYLETSLARFWDGLLIAPRDGERGARMLVLVGGITSTWLGALALGAALAAGRNLFAWSLPILTAVGLIAILGGGTGLELIFGIALLFLLTIVAGARQRQHIWERKGADYSTEIMLDVLSWGSGVVMVILVLALILPTSVSNPLADLLWRDVEVPSGIAVLERNIQRPRTQPKIDVGLSTLPVLELGQSLEQPPPSQVIMRVRLNQSFQPGPWPRYWRARVLNLYNGRYWTTNARVSSFDSLAVGDQNVPGMIVQDIEDLRVDRTLVVGLADVFGVNLTAQAERLPDGTLVALTQKDAAPHYQVVSRPQELAAPPRLDGPPPDMGGYLGLPRNYSPRVIDLAHVIVGTRQGAYTQALAIEEYLRGLPYTYQVQPLPAAGDAVEQFLFDMRAGYCTYYASAMAVMARSLGIPARVAIGYATGEYDQASGAYLIRQSDAHAWPELYIDGRWLPFEPTPIRALPARTQSSTAPEPEPAPAPAVEDRTTGPLIWVGVLTAVVMLVLFGVWLGRPRTPRSLATQVQARLERGGTRAGLPWPAEGATLHEYGALLAPHTADAADALAEVVDLVEQERYGGHALGGEQESRLRRAAQRVFARLAQIRASRRS